LPHSPTSEPRAGFLGGLLLVSVLTLSASCARRPQSGAAAGPPPQAAGTPAPPIPWGTIQPPSQVGAPAGTPGARPTRLPVKTFRGTGVVHAVYLKDGWFEIDHEDIEGYMPAMRMQWTVRDKSMLKSVSAGDKVDFTVEDDNGTEIVTEIKKRP
jgi:Cu/Ag efflux protein CusF